MRTTLVILCGLALVSCRPISARAPNPTEQAAAFATAVQEAMPTLILSGTSWQLESFWGNTDDIWPLPTVQPTLNFFLERYAGYGGCNWFLGVHSVSETNMRLLTPSTTRIFCDEPGVMEQEATYMVALRNIITYSLEDQRLLGYSSANQLLLTFVPAEMLPLEGTTWQVAMINDVNRRPLPVVSGSFITLEINGEEIGGSAGCNTYSGPVTLREGELLSEGEMAVGQLISTRMACSEPSGVMEQEQRFLSVLQTVVSYERGASTLVLYNADGEPVILLGARIASE
ncbi:MAG: META domain-containing protein [Caldilineaceae bacterium]|nr:META domain-containing protein [Caldilineaceae bacterium]